MAIAIKTAIPLRLVKLFTLLWELLRDSGTPVHQSRNVQRAFLLFTACCTKEQSADDTTETSALAM